MTADYIAEAHRTVSDQYHGELVPFHVFKQTLCAFIVAARDLDSIKKTLFYGRELPSTFESGATDFSPQDAGDCERLPAWVTERSDCNGEAVNLLHGIIGVATETGEMLEALWSVLVDSTLLDRTNMVEESGDVFWYLALIAQACKFNFANAQEINIAKLRKRFPERFTEDAANQRDLFAERKVLEGSERAFYNPSQDMLDKMIAEAKK